MAKKLSPHFRRYVYKYWLVKTDLAPADICIVFGGASIDQLAQTAYSLYQKDITKYFVVTGAPISKFGKSEAKTLRDLLVAKGIPKNNILVEGRARNTGENVCFSKALIDQKIGLSRIKSIVAVGQVHASRRFLMTLEKEWPEPVKMFMPANRFSVRRRHWYKHAVLKNAVLRELSKAQAYKKLGLIKEIDLKKNHQRIQSLRQHFNAQNGTQKKPRIIKRKRPKKIGP